MSLTDPFPYQSSSSFSSNCFFFFFFFCVEFVLSLALCIYIDIRLDFFFPFYKLKMQPDSWLVPVEVMLASLYHGELQACSISRVPDMLRDAKGDAYKPKLASVGPLHRGTTRDLLLMEEHKWHYMKDFLHRKRDQRPETGLRISGTDILNLDEVIRPCYGVDMELDRHELAKIMTVDGCFLLELLLRLGDYMHAQPNLMDRFSDDPFLGIKGKVLSVLNDISMLENQIPFIVLKRLYWKVFPDDAIDVGDDHRVADVMRRAFGYPLQNSQDAAHILHLMHLSTVEQGQPESRQSRQACQELERCATRLRAAGITIRLANRNGVGNGNNNQRELVDIFDFDISFIENEKVLEIPPLHIKETTEVWWRNLIAWEQSKVWIRCKYTSYALFFQGLICCKHDIELLEEIGVIVNESKKSKEELLTMLHAISKGAEHMDSSYRQLCESLNKYRAKEVTKAFHGLTIITWHQCRRVFEVVMYCWRNWYNDLMNIPTAWKLVGILQAALLLVLTIMQTYYAAKGH